MCCTIPCAHGCGRTNGGFTLIELLSVAALIAVLAVIAAPSYLDYLTKVKLAGHGQFVLETLRLARVEAVTRTIPVSVCASSNGVGCTGTPWEQGWLVFSDEGLAGIIDGNDVVLRAVAAYEGGVTLDVNITKGGGYFQFDPAEIKVVNLDPLRPNKIDHYAQLASDLAEQAVLTMLGIKDAFAKGKKNRRRKHWQRVCSGAGAARNPHCMEPLAVLEFCHDSRGGETGTAVRAVPSGEGVTEEIDCE